MEIIEKKEYSLLSRTEIIAKESYTGATPSRDTIKKILAEKLNAKGELIVIKHIYPEFGFGTAKIIAYLYSNKKDMERIEPEYAFKKGIPKEKKEEKKQDKPKSEEKKKEVKPEQGKEKPAEQEKQDKGKPGEKKPEQKQEEKKEELKNPEHKGETKEAKKEETKPKQEQQENKDTKESKPGQK